MNRLVLGRPMVGGGPSQPVPFPSVRFTQEDPFLRAGLTPDTPRFSQDLARPVEQIGSALSRVSIDAFVPVDIGGIGVEMVGKVDQAVQTVAEATEALADRLTPRTAATRIAEIYEGARGRTRESQELARETIQGIRELAVRPGAGDAETTPDVFGSSTTVAGRVMKVFKWVLTSALDATKNILKFIIAGIMTGVTGFLLSFISPNVRLALGIDKAPTADDISNSNKPGGGK